MTRASLHVLALLGMVGCGDGLVPPGYRGEVLLSLEVEAGPVVDTGDGTTRLSVLWSDSFPLSFTSFVEQPIEDIGWPRVAGALVLRLYSPPPERVSSDRGWSVGRVIAYRDGDRDGKYSSVDLLLGVVADRGLLYAARDLAPFTTPLGVGFPAGYMDIPLPATCSRLAREQASPAGCGVAVGTPCSTHDDCGWGGECLTQVGGQAYPGGYCTADASAGTCVPPDAIRSAPDFRVFARGCATSASCLQPQQSCVAVGPTALPLPCAACLSATTAAPPLVGTCSPTPPPLDGRPDCTSRLGAPCQENSDCDVGTSPGLCLRSIAGRPQPSGYCSVALACSQGLGQVAELFATRWLKACSTQSDCRTSEGYLCHPGSQACVPKSRGALRSPSDPAAIAPLLLGVGGCGAHR